MARTLRALSTAIGVVLTLLFVGLAALPALGAGAMIVTSGSMEPTIPTGAVAVIRDVVPEDVGVGDILTYRGYTSSAPTTHRVISLHEVADEPHYRTQGDANVAPDPDLVPAGGIIGRVSFWLPGLGWALGWLRTPLGRGLVLGLPASLILLREVASVARALRGETTAPASPSPRPNAEADAAPVDRRPEPSEHRSVLFPADILPPPVGPPSTTLPPPVPRPIERPAERGRAVPGAFSALEPRERRGGRPGALGPVLLVAAVLGGAVGLAATRAIMADTVVVGDNTFTTSDSFLLP